MSCCLPPHCIVPPSRDIPALHTLLNTDIAHVTFLVSNLVFHSEEQIAIISEQRVGKFFGSKWQEVPGLWKIDPDSLRDELTQWRSWAHLLRKGILVQER